MDSTEISLMMERSIVWQDSVSALSASAEAQHTQFLHDAEQETFAVVSGVIVGTVNRVLAELVKNTELAVGNDERSDAVRIQSYHYTVQALAPHRSFLEESGALANIERKLDAAQARYCENVFNFQFERLVVAAEEARGGAAAKVSKAVAQMMNVSVLLKGILAQVESDLDASSRMTSAVRGAVWNTLRVVVDERMHAMSDALTQAGLKNEATLVLSLRNRLSNGMKNMNLSGGGSS
eukprot:CAMPEP_0185846350 /NCGR_PEP_ID=MMETSP1354-20130828/2026_1 /TAXON_ID=708628 /ORGANISM="Erythrolobus madagascarensis, Strain CCMP3276" /LENGTH=236 /DNA_ID=CAMNT_0028546475 /DNA_START=6 /DNA_END=716 /DNA_ORIENTATION=+